MFNIYYSVNIRTSGRSLIF